MKEFVALFNAIDQTNSTNEKVAALVHYFQTASDEDKLWTVALFTGRNPKRLINKKQLIELAADTAGIPLWLFEETYHFAGDLSETIASLLPNATPENHEHKSLHAWMKEFAAIRNASDDEIRGFIFNAWKIFNKNERFVFNKLTSGAFRMGVSQTLMTRALAKALNKDEQHIAHRLMGEWHPTTTTFEELLLNENAADEHSKPYPFYLAYALEGDVSELGNVHDWQAEYKWDGIRAQLIVRDGKSYLWSRGEELITNSFPEIAALERVIPDGTVLDGELLVLKNGVLAPFQVMQTRISRKKPSAKMLQENPAVLYAYDLLELNGEDIRHLPLKERRSKLEQLVNETRIDKLILSPEIKSETWQQLVEIRTHARQMQSEGLMLKHKDSGYETGRKKGNWWKWKVDPMTVDAVMIYAMNGSGRRANLFTDYTFAVRNEKGELVPFAKAYSGLTDAEIKEVDAWIRKNTIDKFGPVRSVIPELVFELGFEAINFSTRHKSGVAVRFPRILRWRKDKPASEIDTLEQLKNLIVS